MATKYLSIDTVVGRTQWSDGLKKSMIQDFVKSGYGNVSLLIGADAKETSKNIQNKVRDFSSGKNTYLQANQLAEIIHSMGSGTPRRYYKRKVQTDASQDGDVLKDCSGWTITKKNLEDGRIVYNANIKAETPKNKGDWATIKGDVYVETTFKWNFKFQKFERWGQIENESEIIEKLCQVLSKYYEGGEKPAPQAPAPEVPTPDASLPEVGDRFIVKTERAGIVYEITKMDMGTVFVKPDGRDFEVPYTFSEVKNNFADGRWVKIQDEEEETPAPESPKQQKSIKDIAEEVINLEYDIWNRLGINSGSQLLASEQLQEKYADEVKKVIIPVLEKFALRDSQKLDFRATLTDENAHKLNNSLSLIGYYGQDDKEESVLDYEKNPQWSLNPKYYTEKPESQERVFMVGDIFYVNEGSGEKYYISSIYSNDEVGFATLKKPKAESIFGTVEEVNKLFKEGKWVKAGRYDYPEETPKAKSKEDIEKAIKGLQFLADKGNEKAKKAIIGLKILLNK